MNYRHIYHAGNFADLMKHGILVTLLQALSRKAKPWCYFDTHAGAGLYDTQAEAAVKTAEAAAGIGRLWQAAADLPDALQVLYRIVQKFNPGMQTQAPRYYPGSPLVAAALAREHDRLILSEKQPDEAALLKQRLHRDARVAVHVRDGYEMLRALVPPPERRGLVLIDPPFERDDEFVQMADTCTAAHRRWPEGVYCLWYPIKDTPIVTRFHRRLRESGMRRILSTALRIGPPNAASLSECGMLIVNPPWQTDAEIARTLAFLARTLAPARGGSRVNWLVME